MKKSCLELIASCPDVVVTTVGADGFPQARVMFNLRGPRYPELQEYLRPLDGMFRYYLDTNTSASKVGDVRSRPRASLLFCRPIHPLIPRFMSISGTLRSTAAKSENGMPSSPTPVSLSMNGWSSVTNNLRALLLQ